MTQELPTLDNDEKKKSKNNILAKTLTWPELNAGPDLQNVVSKLMQVQDPLQASGAGILVNLQYVIGAG